MAFPRFKTLEDLEKHYKTCPICGLNIVRAAVGYSHYYVCNEKHYVYLARSNFLREDKKEFCLINENYLIDNFLITFGHDWYMKKTIPVTLFLIKDIINIKKSQNIAYLANQLKSKNQVIWSKRFTYNKFIKNFKFNDKEQFKKKLDSLKKTLVLL